MNKSKSLVPVANPVFTFNNRDFPQADPGPTAQDYDALLTVESHQKASTIRSERKRTLLRIFISSTVIMLLVSGLRHAHRGFKLPRCLMRGRGRLQSAYLTSLSTLLPTHYTLPSGDRIPSVALGCWKAKRDEVGAAVKVALKAGYRHFDGAWIYRNEAEIGKALSESNVPREDLWLTSKLWNTFHAPDDVERALDETLAKLRTDYLDMYLIHWPVAYKKDGTPYDKELTENPYPTWQKLEQMVEKGKVRNIGVCNFNIRRFENLTANPLKIRPAVNQVELSYWIPQPELIQWAKAHDLLLEAYSPLGGDGKVGDTLNVSEVKEIAAALGMTPAQVIISWHVQRGTVVMPKSVTPSRIVENLQVRAIPQELFDKLEKAATSHEPYPRYNPSKTWGLDFDVFD